MRCVTFYERSVQAPVCKPPSHVIFRDVLGELSIYLWYLRLASVVLEQCIWITCGCRLYPWGVVLLSDVDGGQNLHKQPLHIDHTLHLQHICALMAGYRHTHTHTHTSCFLSMPRICRMPWFWMHVCMSIGRQQCFIIPRTRLMVSVSIHTCKPVWYIQICNMVTTMPVEVCGDSCVQGLEVNKLDFHFTCMYTWIFH